MTLESREIDLHGQFRLGMKPSEVHAEMLVGGDEVLVLRLRDLDVGRVLAQMLFGQRAGGEVAEIAGDPSSTSVSGSVSLRNPHRLSGCVPPAGLRRCSENPSSPSNRVCWFIALSSFACAGWDPPLTTAWRGDIFRPSAIDRRFVVTERRDGVRTGAALWNSRHAASRIPLSWIRRRAVSGPPSWRRRAPWDRWSPGCRPGAFIAQGRIGISVRRFQSRPRHVESGPSGHARSCRCIIGRRVRLARAAGRAS
jgi:hypothetical protein